MSKSDDASSFRWSEAVLLDALRKKFSWVSVNSNTVLRYAFATHVRDNTGFDVTSTIDAVAVDCWKGHGHDIHAFEVKCNRGDWLREIKPRVVKKGYTGGGWGTLPEYTVPPIIRPALEKSARARELCDTFTVVAPKGVVKVDELPEHWGLIEAVYSDRVQEVLLRTKIKAKRLDGEAEGNTAVRRERSERQISMPFATSIMRSIGKQSNETS